MELTVGKDLSYSVTDNGNVLLKDNTISLNIEGKGEIGTNAKVTSKKANKIYYFSKYYY